MKLGLPVKRKHSRIEIIPLIDIMFFLLASFMLVSLSMVQMRGVNINLPTASNAASSPQLEPACLLEIAVSGANGIGMDAEAPREFARARQARARLKLRTQD